MSDQSLHALHLLYFLGGDIARLRAVVGATKEYPQVVVEGDIISDSTVVFQLSKTLPLDISGENEDLFDTFQNVDAEVCVKGSDGTLWQAQWWGRGKYRVEIGTLKPDVEYHLEIQYNGDTYQSEPQRPLKTRGIEKMAFRQPDLNGPVTISLDTEEGEAGGADYYLWFFEEDWEISVFRVTCFRICRHCRP